MENLLENGLFPFLLKFGIRRLDFFPVPGLLKLLLLFLLQIFRLDDLEVSLALLSDGLLAQELLLPHLFVLLVLKLYLFDESRFFL